MQIDPQVYIIGSGQLGFDMTDPFDCHVYLFDAGGTYVVFDAGTGMGIDQILDVCQRDGLDPANVDHLFLTHAHSDHGGGAAHLYDRTDCTVYAGASTARIVTAGDEEAVSLPAAKAGGSYPKEYVYKPCPVEEIVEAGDEVEIVARVDKTGSINFSHNDQKSSLNRPSNVSFINCAKASPSR